MKIGYLSGCLLFLWDWMFSIKSSGAMWAPGPTLKLNIGYTHKINITQKMSVSVILNHDQETAMVLPPIMSGLDWANMLIAGGWVSSKMTRPDQIDRNQDIDIFFYGLPDTKSYTNKIKSVISGIVKQTKSVSPEALMIIKQSDYTIKMIIKTGFTVKETGDFLQDLVYKIDLILITYETPAAVLDSFDIAPAMFGYNPEIGVITNKEGTQSYVSRSFDIKYDRLSGTYPVRATKYIGRGYILNVPEHIVKMFDPQVPPCEQTVTTDYLLIKMNYESKIYLEWNPVTKITGPYLNTFYSSASQDRNMEQTIKNHNSGFVNVICWHWDNPITLDRDVSGTDPDKFVYREFVYRVLSGQGAQFNPLKITKDQLWANAALSIENSDTKFYTKDDEVIINNVLRNKLRYCLKEPYRCNAHGSKLYVFTPDGHYELFNDNRCKPRDPKFLNELLVAHSN